MFKFDGIKRIWWSTNGFNQCTLTCRRTWLVSDSCTSDQSNASMHSLTYLAIKVVAMVSCRANMATSRLVLRDDGSPFLHSSLIASEVWSTARKLWGGWNVNTKSDPFITILGKISLFHWSGHVMFHGPFGVVYYTCINIGYRMSHKSYHNPINNFPIIAWCARSSKLHAQQHTR